VTKAKVNKCGWAAFTVRLMQIYHKEFKAVRNRTEVNFKPQFVPRSKTTVSVLKTTQIRLYREISNVLFETHTKPIHAPCKQNEEFLNVKPGGT
jgi:hypothetical protein